MSGDAPAWVSYAALGVSGIAAAISSLSYWYSGPRIRLRIGGAAQDSAAEKPRVLAVFKVVNKGRGDTTIVGFHVTPYGERKPVVGIDNQQVIGGPSLPHRMEGNSQETWVVDILPALRKYGTKLKAKEFKPNSSWPSMLFFTVQTGNGKFAHDKSSKYDAYGVVADVSFPPEAGTV